MVDITIVNGVYKPTYNWGGHYIVCSFAMFDYRRVFYIFMLQLGLVAIQSITYPV